MPPILLIIAGMFLAFCLLDLAHQARAFPHAPLWRLRGTLAFVAYFAVAFTAPLVWDAWLSERRLFDASVLPLWAQVAGGFLVAELIGYAWHRTMHASDVLWRHVHQTHHSAERIDIWGAFWFHPLDMLGWAFVGSFTLVFVFGVQMEAAIAVNLMLTGFSMFTHANLSTPWWLGFVIARPEMHAAHHERGVHRGNYCDLPLIDMLFGTWRNPKVFEARAGFEDGGSLRLGALLVGRKIA